LQQAHPHASFSELGVMLGKGWQETTEEGRAKYMQQYEATKKAQQDRRASEAASAAAAAAAAAAASGSLKRLPGAPRAGGAGGGDLYDPPRAHGKQSDAAIIEDLRRQLKEARAELKKSAVIMEKLQMRVMELRKTRHLNQKREKRALASKDKFRERQERELKKELFKAELRELKERARAGDLAAARSGFGGAGAAAAAAVAVTSASSSSSSSSSAGNVYRLPPSITEKDNVNPTNRTRTLEGPQNGEGRFNFIKRAMLRYRELYGTFHPPIGFVIPWTDDWPEEMWGHLLGSTVNQIRSGKSYLKKREELEAMGFSYVAHLLPKYEREYDYSVVRAALVRYKELKGHVRPRPDEVCEGDEYPENLRGFKIGLIVPHIKSGKCWRDMRDDLNRCRPLNNRRPPQCHLVLIDPYLSLFPRSVGINFTAASGAGKEWAKYDYDFVKRMLLQYSSIVGNMRVPRPFVVPATAEWPVEMHGVELGKVTMSPVAGPHTCDVNPHSRPPRVCTRCPHLATLLCAHPGGGQDPRRREEIQGTLLMRSRVYLFCARTPLTAVLCHLNGYVPGAPRRAGAHRDGLRAARGGGLGEGEDRAVAVQDVEGRPRDQPRLRRYVSRSCVLLPLRALTPVVRATAHLRVCVCQCPRPASGRSSRGA